MSSVDAPTTIMVHQSVRRRLLDYQIGGKTPEQVITELMDEVPPDYFRRDLQRALREKPRISLKEFRKRYKLPGR